MFIFVLTQNLCSVILLNIREHKFVLKGWNMRSLSNIVIQNREDIYDYTLSKNLISRNNHISKHEFEKSHSEKNVNRKTVKRKYYPKNGFKHRFLASLYIVVFMMFSIVALNGYLGNSSSVGATTNEYTTVTVSKGDTIWQIASDYKSEESNLRQAIYEICKINNINGEVLKPGTKLKIPKSL